MCIRDSLYVAPGQVAEHIRDALHGGQHLLLVPPQEIHLHLPCSKVVDPGLLNGMDAGRADTVKGSHGKHILVTAGCDKDVFTMGTLHGICASGIHPIEQAGVNYFAARQMQVDFLRWDEEKMLSAMQRITDVLCDLARSYIEAVSYTHLDVYKRQKRDCAGKYNECNHAE